MSRRKGCITVIIPVYNVEAYLDRCMDSVLKQSYKDLEIILVDDGATDKSGSMCDEYAKKDNRVKVIHKENKGLSSARNVALDIAEGEYIGFVDSDDYVHPDMFAKLYDAAVRHNSDISICYHYMERKDKLAIEDPILDDEEEFSANQALEVLIKDQGMKNYAWDKLYRAELFDGIRYPVGRNYEDIATTYLLFYKAGKICRIPEYLYYYQIREGSISSHVSNDKKWHENCYQIILSQAERYHFMKEKGEKKLADLCLSEIVPYIYDYISFGVKLHTKKHRDDVIGFLKKEEQNIQNNEFLSGKDKKLFKVYTSNVAVMNCFKKTKHFAKKLNSLKYKGKNALKEIGIGVNKKYNFALQEGRRVRLIFFELPCFDNLGDHAIAYAQKQFLDDFVKINPKYQLYVIDGWDTKEAVCQLKKEIGKSDVILCQGGGNMGSLYDFAETFRRLVMTHFPNNRIVVFPQTIYFSKDEKGKKIQKQVQKTYNKCRHLTICARDHISYKVMKDTFSTEIVEVNDIVSYLDKRNLAVDKRDGIVLCLRSDIESALSAIDKKNLQETCSKVTLNLHVTDTCLGKDIKASEREEYLNKKWTLFGSSRLVVTDRLHGMIFSIITGTPCIVLGNNHHKVKATYETFKDCPYLWYANDVKEAKRLIQEKFNAGLVQEKYDTRQKFSKLEQIIIK